MRHRCTAPCTTDGVSSRGAERTGFSQPTERCVMRYSRHSSVSQLPTHAARRCAGVLRHLQAFATRLSVFFVEVVVSSVTAFVAWRLRLRPEIFIRYIQCHLIQRLIVVKAVIRSEIRIRISIKRLTICVQSVPISLRPDADSIRGRFVPTFNAPAGVFLRKKSSTQF